MIPITIPAHDHRLVLLGEPGSGKSTFVNFLTLELAEANLLQRGWLKEGRMPATLDTLPHWSLGRPLPILVVLRDLAAYASSWKQHEHSRGLLGDFLYAVVLKEHWAVADGTTTRDFGLFSPSRSFKAIGLVDRTPHGDASIASLRNWLVDRTPRGDASMASLRQCAHGDRA